MDRKNPEKKSLEEMTEIVKEEAELGISKPQRRMNRIQTKRGSERLNEYLEKILDLYSVRRYDRWRILNPSVYWVGWLSYEKNCYSVVKHRESDYAKAKGEGERD